MKLSLIIEKSKKTKSYFVVFKKGNKYQYITCGHVKLAVHFMRKLNGRIFRKGKEVKNHAYWLVKETGLGRKWKES